MDRTLRKWRTTNEMIPARTPTSRGFAAACAACTLAPPASASSRTTTSTAPPTAAPKAAETMKAQKPRMVPGKSQTCGSGKTDASAERATTLHCRHTTGRRRLWCLRPLCALTEDPCNEGTKAARAKREDRVRFNLRDAPRRRQGRSAAAGPSPPLQPPKSGHPSWRRGSWRTSSLHRAGRRRRR